MKTLVCVESGKLEYAAGDKPGLQKDHAIIKIKRIGICGTDLHAFEGTQSYFTYPSTMASKAEVSIVNSDSLKDPFAFDKQSHYLPIVKEVAVSNNKLTNSFPPHSFIQIKIAVKK